MIPTGFVARSIMDTVRRGKYNSGEDFVLEYGELRFTFNEADFAERCEQAALRLGFVSERLDESELEDLGSRRQRRDPGPGVSARRARPRLLGRPDRAGRAVDRALAAPSRVPRRLARPARCEGELDVAFDEAT